MTSQKPNPHEEKRVPTEKLAGVAVSVEGNEDATVTTPRRRAGAVQATLKDGILVLNLAEREVQAEPGEAFRRELLAAVAASGAPRVVLDLRGTPYVSSTFLSVVVALHKKVAQAGGRLVLCNLAERVREVFHMLQLASLFEVQPDVDAAVASLTAEPGRGDAP
jgi:anti-sigma B factor antagonist